MKLVILDRDGVINEDSDAYVKNHQEWLPIPGSIEAIARLHRAGYTLCVATNQSGLGRGYFGQADLQAMHDKMLGLIAAAGGRLDQIVYCPHLPDADCDCRKPLPGLVDQILARYEQASIEECWLIGDSLRDLQAGAARNCRPLLVCTGKGAKTLAEKRDQLPQGTEVCADLAAAATLILQQADGR